MITVNRLYNPPLPPAAMDIATIAAIRIQRCWRRNKESIESTRFQTIIEMPHRSFKHFITVVFHKYCHSPLRGFLKVYLTQIIAQRTLMRINSGIPIIIACNSQERTIQLPSYSFFHGLPEEEKTQPLIDSNQFAFTRKGWQEAVKAYRPIHSKQELDALVQKLSSEDLISWELQEGNCWARANLTIQILTLMGIPENCLFKEYALFPSTWWNCYHVAPLIVLRDNTEWIIDPAINRKEAISVLEWYRLYKEKTGISDQISERVSDDKALCKIEANYHHIKSAAINFVRLNPLDALVKVSTYLHLKNAGNTYLFNIFPAAIDQEFFQLLAASRGNVETGWVQSLYQ